ncbi:MAG: hypothetical protein J5542_05475 [Bacteroidales bacterium]|nr:hypothetical protein [Bacteroidales bacterium]
MKRYNLIFTFALVAIVSLVSCNRNTEKAEPAEVQTEQLQTGDLVFVGLPLDYMTDTTDMSSAIVSATGDSVGINYIHVAIAEVANDSVWIIDATLAHGVDRHPLDTFFCDFTLNDGSLPQMDIMRLSDNSNASKYVENAKQFTGRGYDLYFLPDNDEQYCSELVRNSYIDEKGEHLFSETPMNFKADDGTFPPYWVWLFEQIGQPIPQGLPGTNPNAMSKEKCLKKVDIKLTDYSKAK